MINQVFGGHLQCRPPRSQAGSRGKLSLHNSFIQQILLADYVSKAVLYDRGTGHVINNSQISKEIDSVQAFAKSMCRSASQTVSAGGIRLSCHREGKTVPDGVIYS